MSEEMIQQQATDEQDQNNTEKEKCTVIIGNVRRMGKQWLDCVEAATKEDSESAFSVDDVQARLDQAAELLEMMEDSEEPISEV
ncbi:Quinate permease [Venturia nashicola]|uniref:Quinate permease n=1 Tax=Venturia nashicola TaxID=86259 RepID=A0A4Z1PIK5_9PEZI|nr:Quinate permease [Venturia nashicola]TLD37586.1 Quinate permease [Venturia nashicola]